MINDMKNIKCENQSIQSEDDSNSFEEKVLIHHEDIYSTNTNISNKVPPPFPLISKNEYIENEPIKTGLGIHLL